MTFKPELGRQRAAFIRFERLEASQFALDVPPEGRYSDNKHERQGTQKGKLSFRHVTKEMFDVAWMLSGAHVVRTAFTLSTPTTGCSVVKQSSILIDGGMKAQRPESVWQPVPQEEVPRPQNPLAPQHAPNAEPEQVKPLVPPHVPSIETASPLLDDEILRTLSILDNWHTTGSAFIQATDGDGVEETLLLTHGVTAGGGLVEQMGTTARRQLATFKPVSDAMPLPVVKQAFATPVPTTPSEAWHAARATESITVAYWKKVVQVPGKAGTQGRQRTRSWRQVKSTNPVWSLDAKHPAVGTGSSTSKAAWQYSTTSWLKTASKKPLSTKNWQAAGKVLRQVPPHTTEVGEEIGMTWTDDVGAGVGAPGVDASKNDDTGIGRSRVDTPGVGAPGVVIWDDTKDVPEDATGTAELNEDWAGSEEDEMAVGCSDICELSRLFCVGSFNELIDDAIDPDPAKTEVANVDPDESNVLVVEVDGSGSKSGLELELAGVFMAVLDSREALVLRMGRTIPVTVVPLEEAFFMIVIVVVMPS
jgi:hypothetical protein